MDFDRFKEIWMATVGNRPAVANPVCVDRMSDHTIDALVAASNGDFTVFDEVARILENRA